MVLRVANTEAGAVRDGDCPSERSLTNGTLLSAGPLARARPHVVPQSLHVVGRDARMAVDADDVAPSGRLQAAVECVGRAPAPVDDEANTLVLRRPALDDASRAVGGVVVDDDHL